MYVYGVTKNVFPYRRWWIMCWFSSSQVCSLKHFCFIYFLLKLIFTEICYERYEANASTRNLTEWNSALFTLSLIVEGATEKVSLKSIFKKKICFDEQKCIFEHCRKVELVKKYLYNCSKNVLKRFSVCLFCAALS